MTGITKEDVILYAKTNRECRIKLTEVVQCSGEYCTVVDEIERNLEEQ